MKEHTADVAIVGMSCIFPGAPDWRTYWRNIVSKVDAVSDPPDDWGAELYYDPDSQENDRVYCKRGGYLKDLAEFDPLKYGVMPNAIDGGEPDHFLALRVAHDALTDAGYADRPPQGERVEVILGRGAYINRGFTTLVQHGLFIDQTLRLLKELHPEHTAQQLGEIKRVLKAGLAPLNAEVAPGLVPNVLTGRIANRLDLMGANYTVDAACASSLVAVDRGVQDLLNGRCDVALVGGVHGSTPAPILMVFCQLNALSRTGAIRPFSKDADGTLLGEGLGIVVLKRLQDAQRDGSRIYAVIKGVGIASDGRALGLLAPRVEGEELAMRRAYEATGISPRTVGLLEAHGTGTPVGDLTEATALARVFGLRDGEPPGCALGSVKSMISHLIPAAGIAALIKTALSLYYKILPPTLHCDEPDPRLGLDKTPFYINTETRPWIHGGPHPRRAGVNAFGFGGINAHAVLEEHSTATAAEASAGGPPWDNEACVLEGDSRADLIAHCQALGDRLRDGVSLDLTALASELNCRPHRRPWRLAIVAASIVDLQKKLAHAGKRLQEASCSRIKDLSGIYFFERPLGREGRSAFLFPGEGAQYLGMFADLCMHFPTVRRWFDLMDRAFAQHERSYVPSQIVFPYPLPASLAAAARQAREERLWQIDAGAETVFAANQGMFALLQQLGLQPHAVAGHSGGEASALLAAAALRVKDDDEMIEHIHAMNAIYGRLSALGEVPSGRLVVVGAPDHELLTSLLSACEGRLHLTMDNCPHQIVLCGPEAVLDEAVEQLRAKGAVCTALPYLRPYHTPAFEGYCGHLRGFFQGLHIVPPSVPVYSCTTAAPYPPDPVQIRRLASGQWARPVRFRETIERMYQDGIRVFIEVGPKGNLTTFVEDTLRGRPHLAVASNVSRISGVSQLNHVVALLAAHGVEMKLDALYAGRASPQSARPDNGSTDSVHQRKNGTVRLAVGLQQLSLNGHAAEFSIPDQESRSGHQVGHAEPDLTALFPCEQRLRETAAPPLPIDSFDDEHVCDADPRFAAENADAACPPMLAYLASMEQFLAVQQSVMQAYLARDAGHVRSAPPDRAESERRNHLPGSASPRRAASGASPASEAVSKTSRPPKCVGETKAPAPEQGHPLSQGNGHAGPVQALDVLLKLMSDKTGYPVEMLSPSLNLEADLGIDSIKRVEILGAFHRATGLIGPGKMERVSALKTIQQIADFLKAPITSVSTSRASDAATPAAALADDKRFPLLGRVVSLTPGEEFVAVREFDLEQDLFLKDHTLGGRTSATDPSLTGLPLIPLTISMEMMAEAAGMLVSEKLLVALREVRSYQWLALDAARITLQVRAQMRPNGEIHVQIEQPDPRKGEPTLVVEGTAIFADAYANPPASSFALRGARPSRWQSEQLYTECMFHGPSFRTVVAVERWGEDGAEATLKTLPTTDLFRSDAHPSFLTDPVLLDGAGQVVGYWASDHLLTGINVFPYRVQEVRFYASSPPAGTSINCQARIGLVGDVQISSDMDLMAADGGLMARIIGWEDRRFDLPEKFYRLSLHPRDSLVSEPREPNLRDDLASFRICRLDSSAHAALFLEHGGIWQQALAHLVLGRRERVARAELKCPPRRQLDWLLGRCVGKDAVRLLLRQRRGLSLYPADVEIVADEYGQPRVFLNEPNDVGPAPALSIAHADGVAVAIAGGDSSRQSVGIDIERLGAVRAGFQEVAFAPEERRLLHELDEKSSAEFTLRFWCAKEAAAKALGRGLLGGPGCLIASNVNFATAEITLAVSGELATQLPQWVGRPLLARTALHGDLVTAFCILERR
jgi:acyl transferase domain-containing protein/phosphopantetheinyl transferase